MFKIKAIVEMIEFLPLWVVIGGDCIKFRQVLYGHCSGKSSTRNRVEAGSFYQPAADGRGT